MDLYDGRIGTVGVYRARTPNCSASTPGALPFLRTDLPGYQHCRHSRRAGERVRRGLIEAPERI